MADNFDFTPGTGATGSAEDEGGILYPNVKLTASGTGTTEALSKAEDSAHASGNHGIMTLTVRQDTAASLSGTDADYQPLITDVNGRLHVLDQNSAAMLTALQIIDDWDDSDKCKVIIQTGSNAIGKLAANSGIDIGDVDVTSIVPGVAATNLGKARDSALGATDTGVMTLVVRDDTLTTLTPADGDYVPLRVGSTGKLHVTDANITACNTGAVVISSGTVTTVSTVTNLSQLGGTAITMDEGVHDAGCQRVTIATDDDGVLSLGIIDDWDATHASAASADGPQVMGAGYSAGLPTDIGTDGDAVRLLTDRYGRLLRGIMPQWFNAIYDSADARAEGQVVKAATASRKIYIMSYTISTDVEQWVKLQDEDSNALIGKLWLKAGGGATKTYPPEAPLVLNVVNKALEVISEAAGNISVEVTGYLAV